jgi:hypothetical protein
MSHRIASGDRFCRILVNLPEFGAPDTRRLVSRRHSLFPTIHCFACWHYNGHQSSRKMLVAIAVFMVAPGSGAR